VTDKNSENEAKIAAENHSKCVDRFIELANSMKDEGLAPGAVSHALMSASGIYATYAIAGNANGLNQAGVEKLSDIFKANLENVQRSKREQARED
jgi:hypothetical protein